MKATLLVILIGILLAANNDTSVTNLDNADRNIRLTSIAMLAKKGNSGAVDPLLKRFSIEKDRDVRAAILRGLAEIGDDRAAPVLRQILLKNSADSADIIVALANLRDHASVQLLRKKYWEPATSAAAANALFQLGDRTYVTQANRWRRILAVWIPLGFLILVAITGMVFSKNREREIFRISLAAANGAVGFMLGFFLFFLGSLLTAPGQGRSSSPEWAGIAYIVIAMMYGFFCGFFSALAPFVQIRGWRPIGSAIGLSAAAVLLSPLVLTSMTKVFTQTNAETTSPFVDFFSVFHSDAAVLIPFVTALLMAGLAVLLCAWAVSLPLKRVQCEPPFSTRQFLLVALILGVVFMLHDPIAHLIVSYTF